MRRVDFLPWEYDPYSEEGAVQARRRQELIAAGAVLGESVFIAPNAAVFCEMLQVGDRSYIAGLAYVTGDIRMGADCTLNPFTVVRGKVRLGDGVRIGAHASILGFNHAMEPDAPVFTQPVTSAGITIGDDVWIGSSATILDGVAIGDHVVIGAGSVVTRSIPDYAVVAGSPARVLRDRRAAAQQTALRARLTAFGGTARSQISAVLDRSFEDGRFVDKPTASAGAIVPTIRPWADAVELADLLLSTAPPGFDSADLVRRLSARQDPATGLVADGDLSDDALARIEAPPRRLHPVDHTESYHILSVGYAVHLLGGRLQHPIRAVHEMTGEEAVRALDVRDWGAGAWASGSAIDTLATGCAFNMIDHADALDGDGSGPLHALLGWATARADATTGMWGVRQDDAESPWLQAVNGFYRLTRGSFAQFGIPLPYPTETIDTVLEHAADPFLSTPVGYTACNILDIAHPLRLAAKQTSHRRAEIETWAHAAIEAALSNWVDGVGIAFSPRDDGHDGVPGLQGTEMWLSIIWLLADLVGASDALGYRPRGVHDPEPRLRLPPVARAT